MKTFLTQNRVAIISMLMALSLVIQQAASDTSMDWLAIGYAAGVAVLGVIANAWKGKGLTILGIIGTVAFAFVDIASGGAFTWKRFILSAVSAVILAALRSLEPPTAEPKY